ncbi:hypothetical protein FQR65_LT17724 [Abscondita terminalis]|nr:hypothetical protein FQR65_LT17724 [Abscondita terminalis]
MMLLSRWEESRGMEEEEYTLTVDGSGILIRASSAAGAFYGLQSLKSILPPVSNNVGITLAHLQVKDKPGLSIACWMPWLMYKPECLFFIFGDFTEDEAGALKFRDCPNLLKSEVSPVSNLLRMERSLQPAYRSGAAVCKGQTYHSGAGNRNSGHARAAIKSMQARYEKYMKQGNQAEAEKYLLYDLQDKSEYNSAQNWNDNVMNPALPSTYTFIAKVVDELKAMHKAAGVELKTIHLGRR